MMKMLVATLCYNCQTWTLTIQIEWTIMMWEMRSLRRVTQKIRSDLTRNYVSRSAVGSNRFYRICVETEDKMVWLSYEDWPRIMLIDYFMRIGPEYCELIIFSSQDNQTSIYLVSSQDNKTIYIISLSQDNQTTLFFISPLDNQTASFFVSSQVHQTTLFYIYPQKIIKPPCSSSHHKIIKPSYSVSIITI